MSAANSHSSAGFLSGRGRRTSRTEARPVEGNEGAAKLPRPRAAADAHFAALPLVRSPATRSARLPSLRSAHFAPRRASPLARHFRPAGGLGRSPITPKSRSSNLASTFQGHERERGTFAALLCFFSRRMVNDGSDFVAKKFFLFPLALEEKKLYHSTRSRGSCDRLTAPTVSKIQKDQDMATTKKAVKKAPAKKAPAKKAPAKKVCKKCCAKKAPAKKAPAKKAPAKKAVKKAKK